MYRYILGQMDLMGLGSRVDLADLVSSEDLADTELLEI